MSGGPVSSTYTAGKKKKDGVVGKELNKVRRQNGTNQKTTIIALNASRGTTLEGGTAKRRDKKKKRKRYWELRRRVNCVF